MASTTNYNWSTPDDTSLVKDGAAAIRTLGSSIDTTTKALNPSTTLGDIEYRSSTANTNTRLGIGLSGQVLTVSGGVPAWSTPTGTSGPIFSAYRGSSQQSFSQNTWTKVQFNAESFDSDSCYDNTTNYRFTPTKAGYYQFTAGLAISRTGSYASYASFYKNGSEAQKLYGNSNMPGTNFMGGNGLLVYMNGTTDYMEVYVYDSDPSARNVQDSPSAFFSGVWIRS